MNLWLEILVLFLVVFLMGNDLEEEFELEFNLVLRKVVRLLLLEECIGELFVIFIWKLFEILELIIYKLIKI